jgi:hypothetical protein
MAGGMRRSELLAYLIGAGVAGTLLVLPYTGRALLHVLAPTLLDLYVPFFLLPIVWGGWNWLYARRRPRVGIGIWGAILGFILALVVNGLLYGQGQWFGALVILPAYLPVVYGLVWLFVIGSLNEGLGVT